MYSTPYDDRNDLQKIQSQWNKIGGLIERGRDWSAAIVRAATAAEIAANVAVRQRFAGSGFDDSFVDGLLKWANGIEGKFQRLIIPAEQDATHRQRVTKLRVHAGRINLKRNEIVHRGAFANEEEAAELIALAREVVHGLVQHYHPEFQLQDKKVPRPGAKQ